MTFVVANNNRCGFCRARHGGTDHLCDVHGLVSQGCCPQSCDRTQWDWVQGIGPVPAGFQPERPERYDRRLNGDGHISWWEKYGE